MNLFISNNRVTGKPKTCKLPGRLMEKSRFCTHPLVDQKIVQYYQCAQCEFNNDVIRFGLFNSARLVTETIPDSVLCMVESNNDIIQAISDYKPDIVFIEAIILDPSFLLELTKYYSAKYVVRIHSKSPFLNCDPDSISKIIEYSKIPNVILSFNNLECDYDFNSIGIKSVYLPNIYKYEKRYTNIQKGEFINIGCFGAFRWLKNQLHQAILAIRFANLYGLKLRFHVNGNRFEHSGDTVATNLEALFKQSGHELVKNNWLNHEDFLKLVSEMHIGMQFSFTESFNIVSADFVSQNIPVITSNEIKFIHPIFRGDPVNSNDIIKALMIAYHGIDYSLQRINMNLLDQHNNQAIDIWKEFLNVN